MEIGERIRNLRISKGLSQTELAEIVNTTKQNIYKYERGIINNIPSDKLEIIAHALGTTPAYLMGWEDEELTTPHIHEYRIPVVATVAGGTPIWSDEEILEWIDWHKPNINNRFFAVKVKGDSMTPRINDGDIIVIDKESDYKTNDIVVVTVNGYEGTCKKIQINDHGINLIPINPNHDTIFYSREEVKSLPVRIIGTVKEIRSRL